MTIPRLPVLWAAVLVFPGTGTLAASPPPQLPASPARVLGVSGRTTRLAVSLPGANLVRVQAEDGTLLQDLERIPEPLGLALSASRALVGSGTHGSVEVLDLRGRPQGALGAGQGEFLRPSDLAVSPVDGTILVVDSERREVALYDPVTLARTGTVGSGILTSPAAVAVAADGTIFIGDMVRGVVDRFNPAGAWLGSFTTFGSRPGQTVRPMGIDFDAAGRVYVVDSFLDQVLVYQPDGTFQTALGGFGTGPGLMRNPLDVWVDPATGVVWVTDSGDRELESFPPLP